MKFAIAAALLAGVASAQDDDWTRKSNDACDQGDCKECDMMGRTCPTKAQMEMCDQGDCY
jgi:hypothetical protein